MDIDVITSYAWIVLIGIFLVVEVLTTVLVFLMLALGSIAGLLAATFGAPLWLQVVIASVVAMLLLFVLRPPLLRRLHRGDDPAKSNVDALIGMLGRVVETVTSSSGLVRLANGEVWTARTAGGDLPPDTEVEVREIGGAIAVVAVPARTERPSS